MLPDPMMVMRSMESYWTGTLGNASSPLLPMLWHEMAKLFKRKH